MIAEVDGKVFLEQGMPPIKMPMTAGQLHKLTGMSLKEINELEKHGFIKPIKQGTKNYFTDEDIQLVENWAKIHSIGFLHEQGFNVSHTLKMYRDSMDRMTEQEALLILNNLPGKVEPQTLINMIEKALTPMTIILQILHKRSIVKTVAEYGKSIS